MRRTAAFAALVLVGWVACAATPGPRIAWDAPVELASGRGERGEWRQNESRYDFVDDPALAVGPAGEILVAWVDQNRKAVLARWRDASGRLGPGVGVDRQPATFSWIPRVALAPDDPRSAVVLWQEIIFSGGSHGGDMMVAHSTDGGRTFSPPRNLSRSTGGDGKGRIRKDYWHNGSYDLQVGAGGRAFVAWTEFDGPLWFARSTDGGHTFTAPLLVAGRAPDLPARLPSLALHRDGSVLLAWTQGENDGADIQVARWAGSERGWQRGVAVGDAARYDDAPVLAVDREGTVHLAWSQSAGKPLEAQRVLYARSRDGGRTFEQPRVIATAPAPYASAAYPSIQVDVGGRVWVVCELFEYLAQRPRGLAVTLSLDGGSTFLPASLVPGSSDPRGGFNGSMQGTLRKLALARDGTVFVVNSALREGSHSRIWLLRGRIVQ